MIKVLPQTSQALVATLATGRLTDEDYEIILPLWKEAAETGEGRIYFEMKDFSGWEISALWQDIKFDVQNADKFKKLAMVGEKGWQKLMTDLMKPFASTEIKYFNVSEKAKALKWVNLR